jgi:hypothetical protein
MASWKEAAASEGQESERIPDGFVGQVAINRVLFAKRDGTEFKSSKGDPQMFVIFENSAGEEASQMYTLSDAAMWVLAKMMQGCGIDLDQLDKRNVTPATFYEQQDWTNKLLIGRSLQVKVTYKASNNGQQYATVKPILGDSSDPAPAPAATRKPAPTRKPEPVTAGGGAAFDPTDIPFSPDPMRF